MNHELPPASHGDRETYEAPRVIEDLPLESMSLACNSKFDESCPDGGGGQPS